MILHPKRLLSQVCCCPPEGEEVAFSGLMSIVSEEASSITSYQWTFGDGGTASGAEVTHTYADNGTYDVNLTVTDNLNVSDDTTDAPHVVTVTNVAPQITAIIADPEIIAVGQNSTITVTATDVAGDIPLGYHFDCNNDQFFEVKQTGGNSTVCAFPEGSIHQVNVEVLDKDGGVDTSFTTVTVGNVAPIVTPVADVVSVDEGFELVLSPIATFTDPGALDTHTATIDWDDGNIDQVLLAEVHFAALLEGAQEVPPVAVGEAGLGVFAINTAQTELQFLIEVDENLLTGPIISAHIHNASAGENGGVVRTLTQDFAGEWPAATGQPGTSSPSLRRWSPSFWPAISMLISTPP